MEASDQQTSVDNLSDSRPHSSGPVEPWKGKHSSFQQLNYSAWSPGEVPLGLCGPAECLLGCMKKERCLPTAHLCDGEKQAIVPMCSPNLTAPQLQLLSAELQHRSSSTGFKHFRASNLSPAPPAQKPKPWLRMQWNTSQQRCKLEKIVINVDKMSLQEEKKARHTRGHSKIVFAGSQLC